MPFLQVRVQSRYPEFAEEILLGQGASSVSLVDAGDDPILEPPLGESPLWPTTIAIGLFAENTAAADIEVAVRELLPDGATCQVVAECVQDQDWVRVWLKDCPPLKFGDRLWVCPRERRIHEPGCTTLILDPGLAFGTGTHPSTALCLDWLARNSVTGQRIVDFGCGSGILGIAALLLEAAECTAFDIDPQAIQATRDNAHENGVAARLRTIAHDATFEPFPADLVLANILARPLVELAPLLAASVRAGGAIVLAGLLDRQADEVRDAYAQWFTFEAYGRREGWTRIAGRRNERHAAPRPN